MTELSDEERLGEYRYYILGDTVPIRAWVSKSGGIYRTDVPNYVTGELAINMNYLRKIRESLEIDQVDKAAFDEKFRERILFHQSRDGGMGR